MLPLNEQMRVAIATKVTTWDNGPYLMTGFGMVYFYSRFGILYLVSIILSNSNKPSIQYTEFNPLEQ